MQYFFGYVGVLCVGLSAAVFAANPSFSDAQKKEVQSVVHDYLVTQPEVLIEASQALQKKQQQRMQEEVQKAVKVHAKTLFQGKLSTVGTATGPVTLVEFFDYQCIHCKKMSPVIAAVMKKEPSLRIVYKDFPIFGDNSLVASKAALAAGLQHQYLAMHEALLEVPDQLTEEKIFKIAQDLKLDLVTLKKDMNSKEVLDELDNNRKLATGIQLMGTPAFIMAATPNGTYANTSKPIIFIPGAASEEALLGAFKKLKND